MRTAWAPAGACIVMIISGAAAAQDSLGIKAGEIVYDRSGGTVGTISRVGNDEVIVDTGNAKVTLGLSSFLRRDGKLVLPVDRAALEAAAAKVQADGDAAILPKLTPGASFYDASGELVGAIVSVEGQKVTIDAGTVKAALPLSAFVAGPKGPEIRATRADFLAKLEAQRPKAREASKPAESPKPE